MTEHVLTIDLGTSGPKVALFTFDGVFVDGDFTPVELNAAARRRRRAVARRVVARRRRRRPTRDGTRRRSRADDVVAVAVTSQWSGTVPIDRDGTPLHDAIIWMDARGADDVQRVVGGPVRVQGYEPRKLRTWISSTGGAPALSGKDSDLAHPLVAARAARHRPRHVEVPRAEGLAQPPAHRPVRGDATTRSCCTGSPTTAISAHVDYDPELLRDRGARPRAAARSRCRRPRSSVRCTERRRPSSACRRASRSSAARPICSRPRSVRARCATSRAISTSARRRGSRATCRSRRPTSSTASRRCRRRCPASTTSPTSRRSRARASTGSRQRGLPRATRCADAAARRLLRAARRDRRRASRRAATA